MNKNQKLINILSIACRAGKILSGDFVIEKALSRKHSIKLILIASDTSEMTRDKYAKLADKAQILLKDVQLKKAELAGCIGKTDRAAVAVCDEGFCKAIIKILNQ